MEPKKVGRALGIGVRVASKMVRQRMAEAEAGAAAPVTAGVPPAPPRTAPAAEPVRRPAAPTPPRPAGPGMGANAKRGAKAFGQALLGPFTHAGGILWLEMTGLFFALFALFFVQSVYRVHAAWKQGPEHTHLLLYGGLALAFAWFSASSFTRAYRKSKRGPAPRH